MGRYRGLAKIVLFASAMLVIALDGFALWVPGPDYPDVIGGRGGIVVVALMLAVFGLGPLLLARLLVAVTMGADTPLLVGRIMLLCAVLIAVMAVGQSFLLLNAELGLFSWRPSGIFAGLSYSVAQLCFLIPPFVAWIWARRRQGGGA